jgi:chromosome partitioning protein
MPRQTVSRVPKIVTTASQTGRPATLHKPPKTIAVVSQKGGAGKTTITMMIAFAAHHDLHKPILVLDGDPSRGSALWADGLPADCGVTVVEADSNDYTKPWNAFTDIEPGLIIIDNPPAVTEPMMRAIDVADLVVIPSKANALDAVQTAVTYAAATRRKRRAVVVASMVKRGSLEEETFPADLDRYGIKHTSTMAYDRIRYARAPGTAPAFLGEFALIWQEVKRMLR